MVATPTAITVATRTPAKITPRKWISPAKEAAPGHPHPQAGFRTAGSTPLMPVYVLRTIGSKEYNTRIIAVLVPPPMIGMGIGIQRVPARYRLNNVGKRENGFSQSWPSRHENSSGTPIAIAIVMETATRNMCSTVC
jgi:hypothetical protein